MKIKSVKIKKAKVGDIADDFFIGSGYRPGGRVSLPDIDIDYASDGKQKVKEYLESKYNSDGTQNVFSAGTLTTLKIKAAMKDVCRVYKVPYALANYITACISDDSMSWNELFVECLNNKKMQTFVNDFPRAVEGMRSIMGQPKATSIHASAVIVTPKFKGDKRMECFDYLPMRLMDGVLVSEFDGYAVEALGLLKNDILATKELVKLKSTIDLINQNYPDEVKDKLKFVKGEETLTMDVIHSKLYEDQRAFSMFSNGHTQNIFQFSGPGMTKFVSEMGLDCIGDITAANALFRPATIKIGAHEDYIRYKRGEAQPIYNWGTEEVTKDTYSILCYQEQFMKISQTLSGFSVSKSDVLRKAIGKKNPVIMASLKKDFVGGAVKNGCPKEEAEAIWHKIEVAGSYSFNASHAAAYGLIAYVGAWLKANFPAAFYTVALEHCKEEEIKVLMGEMGEISNCQIVPPNINVSGLEFFTDYRKEQIFWSLSKIKFVGAKAVNLILADKEEFGDFESFSDFYIRIQAKILVDRTTAKALDERYTAPVNTRTIKNMILTGCFDKLEGVKDVTDRYFILEKFFKLTGTTKDEAEFPAELINQHYFWSMKQIELSGLGAIDYRRIYNTSKVKESGKKLPYMNVKNAIQQENEGRRCAVCATVIDVIEKSGKTKKGDPYVFGKVQMQQNNETIEATLWNDTWKAKKDQLINIKGKVLIINGTLKYNDYSNQNAISCGASVYIETI